MMAIAVHLSIIQPTGYIHSLGFIDQARYVRHQLRKFGVEATIGKNRLRESAINIVFGAHLGFPAECRQRHACLFFNLEQLGQGGAKVSDGYLQLLRQSAVIDYDLANVPAYCDDIADVPVVPFLYAPYLEDGIARPLQERPIDLLFFGSMNARRHAFIERVEACGANVAMFDHPIYGAERDHFIRQAKAVLNCSFYESSRFEQVRVSHCLSLGTPVISERHPSSQPPGEFQDAVFWIQDGELETFFEQVFNRPPFFEQAQQCLESFRQQDGTRAYADLLAFARGFHEGHDKIRVTGPWLPERLYLGSIEDYRLGWLNIDARNDVDSDLTLDLSNRLELPHRGTTHFGSEVELCEDSVRRIVSLGTLVSVPNLSMLMNNALRLLGEGGEFEIEVPYEGSFAAWQDPTHRRAMNEASWDSFTSKFWQSGWFGQRFEMAAFTWLDGRREPCSKENASFMHVILRKVLTSPRERTLARTFLSDFGGIDEDRHILAPCSSTDRPAAPARIAFVAPAIPELPIVTTDPSGLSQYLDEACLQIDQLIQAQRYSEALIVMANAINQNFCQPGVQHHSLYYPEFDRRLTLLANLLPTLSPDDAPTGPSRHNVIIATELYLVGGHSRVVEDVCREVENPVLILTDLFGTYDRDKSQLDWIRDRLQHVLIVTLPSQPLWDKCMTLRQIVNGIGARNLLYFNHHQDPIPFAATLTCDVPGKSLFHHCDHNPSLGSTLPGLRHVDLSEHIQRICSSHLGQTTDLLPLYVPDQGQQKPPLLRGMDFSVVTSGRAGKFSRTGECSLAAIASTVLSTIEGHFIHIGPLDNDWITAIRARLSADGIVPERFITLGVVSSLWQCLKHTEAAFYLGSAPIGGGRAAIEAQGCALPVLYFTGIEKGPLIENFTVYANPSLGWSNLESLRRVLVESAPKQRELAEQARAYYESHFSLVCFRQALAGILAPQEEPASAPVLA